MDELANIIIGYESDTFSAIGAALTPSDAHAMATLLFNRFCKIVAEGGALRCDGDVLSSLLDEVREPEPEWLNSDDDNAERQIAWYG
jgi:hypothetical protein